MTFIYIFVVSLILQFFFPWWIIGPIAFAFAAWKSSHRWQAFSAGFLAIFTLWIVVALFKTLPNDNLLANRIGQMFMLPNMKLNWMLILLITGFVGGITAGLAALTGFYFRVAFSRRSRDEVSLQGEEARSRTNILDKDKRTV